MITDRPPSLDFVLNHDRERLLRYDSRDLETMPPAPPPMPYEMFGAVAVPVPASDVRARSWKVLEASMTTQFAGCSVEVIACASFKIR